MEEWPPRSHPSGKIVPPHVLAAYAPRDEARAMRGVLTCGRASPRQMGEIRPPRVRARRPPAPAALIAIAQDDDAFTPAVSIAAQRHANRSRVSTAPARPAADRRPASRAASAARARGRDGGGGGGDGEGGARTNTRTCVRRARRRPWQRRRSRRPRCRRVGRAPAPQEPGRPRALRSLMRMHRFRRGRRRRWRTRRAVRRRVLKRWPWGAPAPDSPPGSVAPARRRIWRRWRRWRRCGCRWRRRRRRRRCRPARPPAVEGGGHGDAPLSTCPRARRPSAAWPWAAPRDEPCKGGARRRRRRCGRPRRRAIRPLRRPQGICGRAVGADDVAGGAAEAPAAQQLTRPLACRLGEQDPGRSIPQDERRPERRRRRRPPRDVALGVAPPAGALATAAAFATHVTPTRVTARESVVCVR